MLDARYVPRPPRVRAAASAARRLVLHDVPTPERDVLLDLAAGGVKLLAAAPLEAGSTVDLALSHDGLKGELELSATVQWARPVQGGWLVGLRFVDVRDTTRVALERLVALELGSRVLAGARGHVGWVAAADGPAASHYVYDLAHEEVGRLHADGPSIRAVAGRAPEPRQFASVAEAIAACLGVAPQELTLDPPLPGEPQRD